MKPGIYVIEKITDPDFLDAAAILKKQAEKAIAENPGHVQEIVATYRQKMSKLVEWWEYEKVRWTIADVPESR